jgi:hypothetical protein
VKITLDQLETLREAVLPLMQWLNDNCHPHCTVMVNSERIELVEGLATAARLDDHSGERTEMEVQK